MSFSFANAGGGGCAGGVLARLARHAAERGDTPSVIETRPGAPDIVLTWADLNRHAGSIAARLRGVDAQGRVVLLCCPNRAEFIAAALGVLMAEAAVMPLHPRLTPPELRRAACLTDAAAAIATEGPAGFLIACGLPTFRVENLLDDGPNADRPISTSDQDRPALLLQSSGTTGPPRIAVRSLASIDAVAANVALGAGLTPDDEVLAVVPLCHSYGIESGLLGPVSAGATVRLLDGFDPGLVAQHLAGGTTVFPGVPFMFEALATFDLKSSRCCSKRRLRTVFSAGSPMPRSVAARFGERAGIGPGQLYGSTEVGTVTFQEPVPGAFDPACVGAGLPGVGILILDPEGPDPSRPAGVGQEGHIAVRAPSMLSRYLDGDAPLAGGHFLTGDLGRLDASGRLTVTGRLKLQIDVGGLKVNPNEVEAVMLEHPAVDGCVVLPVRLTETITKVHAVVVPRLGAAVTAQDIRRFLGDRLAPYKIPRVIEFRTALPRSAMGKVLRQEVAHGRPIT